MPANVEQEDLTQKVFADWDEFRSEVTLILQKADEHLATRAASLTTSYSAYENIAKVKLPELITGTKIFVVARWPNG